jgi:hypothetical protein
LKELMVMKGDSSRKGRPKIVQVGSKLHKVWRGPRIWWDLSKETRGGS